MPISCSSFFGYGQLEALEQTLTDYLKDEVEYNAREMLNIRGFMSKFALQLNQTLTSDDEIQGLAVSKVVPVGWSWEPNLTCLVSQYDLLVVFRLGAKDEQWSCTKISTSEDLTSVPFIIRRRSPDLDDVTPEYKSKMAAFGNKMYLNQVHFDQIDPVKFFRKSKDFILAHLKDLKQVTGQELPNYEFEVTNTKSCPALMLKLMVGEEEFTLKLIPTLEVVQIKTEVNVGWIWSYNILKEKTNFMVPKTTHWRRCYLQEDEAFLTEFRKSKYQVLSKIFKIIKTLGTTSSLSKLDSYIFKHFFMNLTKKFSYCYHKVGLKEAFKMALVQLEEILSNQNLDHYHESGINVLSNVETPTLVYLSQYLKSVINGEDYLEFLLENKFRIPYEIDGDLLLLEQAQNYFTAKEKSSDKNLKLNEVLSNTEDQFKTILESHFKRSDILNRISMNYHSVNTSYLGTPPNCRVMLIFELDGTLWLPKAEYDPDVLEDDFVPYHCTWAKYTDDFNQNNQALKYGKDLSNHQMDSVKFTSTINGEIQSALQNHYFKNDGIKLTTIIHQDRVEVRVKFEAMGQTVIYDVIPAICFVNNDQIPNTFLLVNSKVANKTYWKRSYEVETLLIVEDMDKQDNGCRKEVMDILVTALSPTPLSKLDGDVVVGAVLNNRHHYGWAKSTKMIRFILDYLVTILDLRVMPHHLENIRNVLKTYDEELLQLCADYLRSFKANSFKPSTYHFLLYRKEDL